MKTPENMRKFNSDVAATNYGFILLSLFTRFGVLWKSDSGITQYNFSKFYILQAIFLTKVEIELKTKTINRAY